MTANKQFAIVINTIFVCHNNAVLVGMVRNYYLYEGQIINNNMQINEKSARHTFNCRNGRRSFFFFRFVECFEISTKNLTAKCKYRV